MALINSQLESNATRVVHADSVTGIAVFLKAMRWSEYEDAGGSG